MSPAAKKPSTLPIGTVEGILEEAPNDIVDEVLEIPEWKCSVRVRSFTASQAAKIRSAVVNTATDEFDWTESEVLQFMAAVVEPKFEEEDVRRLHKSSSYGFKRVLRWITEHSMSKEDLQALREEFRDSDD